MFEMWPCSIIILARDCNPFKNSRILISLTNMRLKLLLQAENCVHFRGSNNAKARYRLISLPFFFTSREISGKGAAFNVDAFRIVLPLFPIKKLLLPRRLIRFFILSDGNELKKIEICALKSGGGFHLTIDNRLIYRLEFYQSRKSGRDSRNTLCDTFI